MAKAKKTTAPVAQRRGLQGSMNIPISLCAMLVLASVEETSASLAKELKTKQRRTNVPRSELPECDLYVPRFYPFQYAGHMWTTVVHRFGFYDDVARRISSALKTHALCVGYEKTAFCYDYVLYDSGKLLEVFHVSDPREFHILTPAEAKMVEEKGVFQCVPHGYFSYSEVRKLKESEFKALSKKVRKQFSEHLDYLFNDFLKNQDAYVAFNIYDEPGREYFPIADASDGEILRIDIVEK